MTPTRIKEALAFYHSTRKASLEDRIAVGSDHIDWLCTEAESASQLIDEMAVMLDLFNMAICTNGLPRADSPCHMKILELMEAAGKQPTDT